MGETEKQDFFVIPEIAFADQHAKKTEPLQAGTEMDV